MSSKNKKTKKSKQSHVRTEMIVRGQANNPLGDQKLYEKVRSILDEARQRVARNVNTEMVCAYWLIGQAIVEHEQKGKHRAGYGEQLIESLSQRLTADVGKGFTTTNLKYMRQFFLVFSKSHALRGELSWTHYRLLMKVKNPAAREFYETEAAEGNWSTRQLERQINSFFYERTAMSTRKRATLEKEGKEGENYAALDFVKDPYVLEFLGLKESSALNESTLEAALLDHLQEFFLELGKGFSLVARQQRITVEGDHFYVDLVLYNRRLRCFVLVELKLGKLTHQDIGQMMFYTNYYTREMREEWENPAVGILLCADKNDAVVRYTLPEGERQIFAAQYKLYLPSEAEIIAEIKREREALTMAKHLTNEATVSSN